MMNKHPQEPMRIQAILLRKKQQMMKKKTMNRTMMKKKIMKMKIQGRLIFFSNPHRRKRKREKRNLISSFSLH